MRSLLLFLLVLSTSLSLAADRGYELFSQMYEQSATREPIQIRVNGNDVTFGGEKEGSSSKVTRVLSPTIEMFRQFLISNPEFAKVFLNKFASNAWRASEVIDIERGNSNIALENARQYRVNNTAELETKINLWCERANSSPFSFINQAARNAIFKFGIKGDAYEGIRNQARLSNSYDSWVVIKGEPQRYFSAGHQEVNGGWELISKPASTYAEFERMITWLRETLGDRRGGQVTNLFEPFGHQRVRIPKYDVNETERSQISELARALQAYILLHEVSGKTGILISKWKSLLSDIELREFRSERSIIRLEQDRFASPGNERSWSIEFRSGVKTEATRRFAHSAFVSRMAGKDFSGLAKLSDYELRQQSGAEYFRLSNGTNLLTEAQVQEVIQKINDIRVERGSSTRSIKRGFIVPLWNWADAPFAKGKADSIKQLQADFVKRILAERNLTYDKVATEMQRWVRASYLPKLVEGYLKPARSVPTRGNPMLYPVSRNPRVNINNIDLGLEFTSRLPVRTISEMNNGNWRSNHYTLTPEQVAQVLEKIANDLARNISSAPQNPNITRVQSAGHGHESGIAFEFEDRKGRTWKVEWDGIGRTYRQNGEVIPESVRGGHIEIVTPKKNIKMADAQAIFKTYEQNGIRPLRTLGGTHVNIDLDLFNKKPERLARFLTLFHQHRGIMTFMFQSIERVRNAEPVNLSEADFRRISEFRGSGNADVDRVKLSQLLYNAHYFNDRDGRKTRYTHWDLTNFFGNIVPAEHIRPDFNVVRIRQGFERWVRQFRVGPHQKMEGRFFDAPLSAMEASLMIKSVRGLLNKTFNSTAQLSGSLQSTTHEQYAENPKMAHEHLKKFCREMGLEYKEYKGLLNERLVHTQNKMGMRNYRNPMERINSEHPRRQGWGQALERPHTPALFSEDRVEQIERENGRMCGRAVPD